MCGGRTLVQKTKEHHVATGEHGAFIAKETILVCAQRCTDAAGRLVTLRSEELRQRVSAGAVYGYDLEVRVGLERYVKHRQRSEIQSSLGDDGIVLSTGQISILAARFLKHLEQLHQQRAPVFRAALEADGGYPLHIDATGEDGRGTLFVAFAGWRRWVLGSWKLSTERAELILPHLQEVVRACGAPCAIMRDLGRAVIKASNDLLAELPAGIPNLGCHRHFLGDIGKDLMEKSYDQLRELVRRFALRTALRKLARDLGHRLGAQLEDLRLDIAEWTTSATHHALPGGSPGHAIIRALAQWALDYAQDGTYGAFPFDRPYLDFYHRCVKVRRSVDAFLRTPPQDAAVCRSLERLAKVLDPVVSQVPFATTAERLSRRAALFDELREALRLSPRCDSTPKVTEASDAVAELRDIREAVDTLTLSLRQRRPERGPAQDQRQAIDLILQHLDRHGESLWGHIIPLVGRTNGEIRVVDRTNNVLEGFWHQMKHGERRRSGRKILTHDFEGLPAAAALAYNLNQTDYVELLCGSIHNLPRAFAHIDQKQGGNTSGHSSDVPETASASLPHVDRPVVRSLGFKHRVEAAANSRAPRYSPPAARCATEF
jgi:hypothetical protein